MKIFNQLRFALLKPAGQHGVARRGSEARDDHDHLSFDTVVDHVREAADAKRDPTP